MCPSPKQRSYSEARDSAGFVYDDSPVQSFLKTYDFLMKKWEKQQAAGKVRRIISKAEHDRIFNLYHASHQTQAQLAIRFKLSPAAICTIVNGNHKHHTMQ